MSDTVFRYDPDSNSWTQLTTDSSGSYQLWLSQGHNPLQITATAPGYQPAWAATKLTAGAPGTANFALSTTG